jgi:hypothetical protein
MITSSPSRTTMTELLTDFIVLGRGAKGDDNILFLGREEG